MTDQECSQSVAYVAALFPLATPEQLDQLRPLVQRFDPGDAHRATEVHASRNEHLIVPELVEDMELSERRRLGDEGERRRADERRKTLDAAARVRRMLEDAGGAAMTGVPDYGIEHERLEITAEMLDECVGPGAGERFMLCFLLVLNRHPDPEAAIRRYQAEHGGGRLAG
jgi:hypothetical protein